MDLYLQHIIKGYIRKGENFYVAECHELPVITQGKTIEDAINNLKEAVALHLEDEDLESLGIASTPTLLITFELELPELVSKA